MRKSIENIKVYIVEDDQEKCDELNEILYGLGFCLDNLYFSYYAEEAIEKINDEYPDVVLLDLKLPYNKDDSSVKIDNSNKVIKEVERLNAARNQGDSSTGIIIISASVRDAGLQNNYKNISEVVAFIDKDEIALDKDEFKKKLIQNIQKAVDRDFRHQTEISFDDIQHSKLHRLKDIHSGLYNRIMVDLLGQFKKLNNNGVNHSQIIENIIGLSGRIVEDILNLLDNGHFPLTSTDEVDNFVSVRNRLTKYTGRRWNSGTKKFEKQGTAVFSRSTAEYARLAYMFRSEALHSKEADEDNRKLFATGSYTLEDAAISIHLIIPLVLEFIDYKNHC